MRESDIWRNNSEAEFDNAMEAMEKLVMNRLYDLYVTCIRCHGFEHISLWYLALSHLAFDTWYPHDP